MEAAVTLQALCRRHLVRIMWRDWMVAREEERVARVAWEEAEEAAVASTAAWEASSAAWQAAARELADFVRFDGEE